MNNNQDTRQAFIFQDANVRGELVKLSTSFQTIMTQHAYPLAIRKVLGEALVVACLLSGIIKSKGRLTVQFQGKKPLKLLLAQCTHKSELRGLAQWDGDLSESDIVGALKKGSLGIIVNPDANTTSYQGIVEWQGDSFAQSVEVYFRDSEQLATRLWLAVNETTAVGLLLQVMPEAENQKSSSPDAHKGEWERIVEASQNITAHELLSLDNLSLLKHLYPQNDINVFEPASIAFSCTCSVERSENAIRMLGKEEATQEVKEKKNLIVTCEFCNSQYMFDENDVANIFKNSGNSSPSLLH
jgi:molecular chaperone Hsp33